MNIKDKKRIKILSIFLLIAILVVAFRVFWLKAENEEIKTADSLAELNQETNENIESAGNIKENEKVNIIELNQNNCEYETEKKKNSITISKYEGDEDCIIIPTQIDGKKVEEIDKNAFKESPNLETIKVPVELKDIITEIECFEVNEENSDEEYIELKTTREYSETYIMFMSLPEEAREKSAIVPYKFEVYATEDIVLNVSASASDSSYDIRDYVEVEVENQGSHGTCYAYAGLSSLEIWIAKNRGELVDFSEVHAGVFSNGSGGIFSNVESYINSSDGPVWEADWDKDTYRNKVSTSDYNMINSYLSGDSEPDINYLKTLMKTQQVEGKIESQSYAWPSISTIKNHIVNYGSICAYYHHDNAYLSHNYNGCGYTTYYFHEGISSAVKVPDHAITIVGWDDNFSRYNFPADNRPDSNGAYLVLNSWGENWGNDGYFWISYEDYWIDFTMTGVTNVIGLGESITLNSTIYKDTETGEEIEKVNNMKNIVNKGTKLGINLDLRDNSTNRLVSTSQVSAIVRNPAEGINKNLTVTYEDGYIVVNVDTVTFTPGAEYIIDISCKGEMISKVIRIRDLYDYEIKSDNTIKLTSYNAKNIIDVIVPKTYDGYTVSELGENLFYNNDEIETVTVYNTVKTVGINLVQKGVIIFGNSGSKVESYAETYGYKFLKIGTTSIVGDFWNFNVNTKTLTINGNMEDYIKIRAPWKSFYKRIYNVNIKDGVEIIGAHAFGEYTNLKYVSGLKDVTKIGEGAFADCTNLISIDKLSKVITLEDFAFFGCESLDKVVIGRDIETIEGSRAFNKSSLTVYGFEGTIIETFAKEKNIPFEYIKVTGIKIKTLPAKTVYLKGEELDLTGGTVIVSYEEGFVYEIPMAELSVSGYNKELLGDCKITVSSGGYYVEFTVTIKEISKIEFKNKPTKTEYIKGEELSLIGERLIVTYSEGSKEEVSITKQMISGYDKTLLGNQNVIITYKGKSITFPVKVTNDITQISIKKLPTNLTYLLGEDLDLTGGSILATYQDKTTKEIEMTDEKVSVTGYDKTLLGDQEITVTYEGKSVEFQIRTLKEIMKIEIKDNPSKTTYIRGEELDLAGGKIIVTYTDNTTEEIEMIDSFIITTGYDKTVLGYQEITLIYEELEVKFVVKVTNDVTSIQIKEDSLKTTYIKGEELDLTGGKILKIYQDKTIEEMLITDEEIKVTGYNKDLLGEQEIKVTYNEFTTTFTVKIINNVTEIQIKEDSLKTTYIKGEELDLTGGKILVTYQNKETKEISMTDKDIQIAGYDKTKLGEQNITITYKEKTTVFIVKVTNDMTGIQIKENPNKTTYVKGEDIDLTGGKILVIRQNQETEEIPMTDKSVKVTGYNKTILGKQILTVKYGENTAVFSVEVTNNVTNVQIKESSIKTTYVKGEELDLKGGIALITYEDNTTEEVLVENYIVAIEGYDKTKIGKQKVAIAYLGYKTYINITVIEPKISAELSIAGQDEIKAGETSTGKLTLNAKGDYVDKVSATLKYDNNISKIQIKEKNGWKVTYNEKTGKISATKAGGAKTEEIAEIIYTVKDSAQKNVNISINDVKFTTIEDKDISGVNISKNVNINGKVEKVLESIKISSKPNKVKYKEGESFNTKGMKVIAQYSDGTEKEIKDYICIPYGSLKKDDDHITIMYTEGDVLKTVEYAIKVEKKTPANNVTDNTDDKENTNVNTNTNNNTNTNINTNNNTNNSNKTENEIPGNNIATNKDENSLPETGMDNLILKGIIIIVICIVILCIIKLYEKYKKI